MSNAEKISYLADAVNDCVKGIRSSAEYSKGVAEGAESAFSNHYREEQAVKWKMLEFVASKLDSEVMGLVEKYLEESF